MRANTSILPTIVLAAAMLMPLAATVGAEQFKVGAIEIAQPWTRATPGGAGVAGGYLTIANTGSVPDRLIGGSSPDAARVEVHEMKMEDGVMKMRDLPGGLEIKPGQKVELKPGGYHVMFMNLSAPLKQGEVLKAQLRFEKAGTVDVNFKVEPIGAQSSQPGAPGGH